MYLVLVVHIAGPCVKICLTREEEFYAIAALSILEGRMNIEVAATIFMKRNVDKSATQYTV